MEAHLAHGKEMTTTQDEKLKMEVL